MATKKSPAKKTAAKKSPAKKAAKKAARKAVAKKAAKPGKQHRGQPEGLSKSHERPGSQLERERHLYPSSNIPQAGSARSNKKPGKKKG